MTPKQIKKLAATYRIEHDGDYSRNSAEMTRDLIAFANAIAAAARAEAIEECANAIDNMNDSAGDRASYDNREMAADELERMHALMDAANAIRAMLNTGEKT